MNQLLNRQRFTLDRFVGVGAEETFAFADLHGAAHLLDLALDAIAAFPPAGDRPRRLVTLGDYIDRGPEGVRAIDVLMGAEARLGFPVTSLLGNHEQMAIATTSEDIPTDRRVITGSNWLANGGGAVMAELAAMGHDLVPLTPNKISMALGPDRLRFLRGLHRFYKPEGGDVMFVHAGLHPHIPLAVFMAHEWRFGLSASNFTKNHDPSWIRAPFLEWTPSATGAVGHHGNFVVHGHEPEDGLHRPIPEQIKRDRLNLDTYAFSTNLLRVARFVGNEVETFDVVPPGPRRERMERGLSY